MQLLPTKRTMDRIAAPTGAGAAKGMEFAMVLVVFFGLGWVLDLVFGTRPWLTIIVGVLGVIGQFARVWYAYDDEMNRHEAELRSRRSA